MKRIVTLLLVLIFVLSMTGCGSGETVEYTISSTFVGDTSEFDEAKVIEENSEIKSAKLNEDGSVTYTITKSGFDSLIKDLKDQIKDTVDELVEGETTAYIKSIDYDDEMKNIDIKVDKEAYENAFDISSFILSMSAQYYQQYIGVEYSTTIKFIDADTDEVISEEAYPKAEE